MADTAQLQSPVWLTATLKALFARYHEIAQAHSTNNGLLVAQDQAANGIQDPTVRAQVKARIQADVRRQALIAGAMRSFYGSLEKGRDALGNGLRLVGVDPSPVLGLSEIGVLPLVPIAIGVGIAAGIGIAAALWAATSVQRQAIVNNKGIIDKYLSGGLPLADALKLIEANTRTADSSKDVLGLTATIQAATPIVLLIVAALIVPRLLDTFAPRRSFAA
jgi:hypothetical protein